MEIRIPEQLYNRVMEYLGQQPLTDVYQLFTEMVVAKRNSGVEKQAGNEEEEHGVRTETD